MPSSWVVGRLVPPGVAQEIRDFDGWRATPSAAAVQDAIDEYNRIYNRIACIPKKYLSKEVRPFAQWCTAKRFPCYKCLRLFKSEWSLRHHYEEGRHVEVMPLARMVIRVLQEASAASEARDGT